MYLPNIILVVANVLPTYLINLNNKYYYFKLTYICNKQLIEQGIV